MKLQRIISLFGPNSELWHGDLSQYGWFKRKLLFLARVVRLVLRGFTGDQCNLHASALTYYTLMSLIPLLALGLSLARVFGGGDLARERISEEIDNIGAQLSAGSVTEASAELTQQFIEQIRQYTDQILDQMKSRADLLLVDFHAEATSEKLAMGWYLDGRVSAVWGTHTHVPTADAKILPGGTGYVTDLGMTGPARSVLGIRPADSINKFLGGIPRRYMAADGPRKLESVLFSIDTETRRCVEVRRVDLSEAE